MNELSIAVELIWTYTVKSVQYEPWKKCNPV